MAGPKSPTDLKKLARDVREVARLIGDLTLHRAADILAHRAQVVVDRSPGRPKGSGKDDARLLDRMADIIAGSTETRPHSAAMAILKQEGGPPTSLLKSAATRLANKFKANRDRLLASARARSRQGSPKSWKLEAPWSAESLDALSRPLPPEAERAIRLHGIGIPHVLSDDIRKAIDRANDEERLRRVVLNRIPKK